MEEIWKDIGFLKGYQVSSNGRIKSLKFGKEKILKQHLDKRGYCYIGLWINRKKKLLLVHRLVARIIYR